MWFNNVLKGARELPIAALVDHTRWKVQDFFQFRRKAAATWKTHLTHRAEKWLDRSCSFGSKFLPRTCSWNEYEVLSSTHMDSVDLEKKTCACGLFQTMGLPCGHAIAAMGLNKLDRYKYCQDWFLASTYRSTYEEWQLYGLKMQEGGDLLEHITVFNRLVDQLHKVDEK
ncbi:uncharacterized protein LOC143856935 [Tasmannia lanceolata]|uniref:uncharacterized protein LOC143856935 n=1 Tax=Tasmannia lanceolata TaxID=3420 RepID=UPI004062D7A2